LTPPARASRPPQVEDAAGAQLLVRMPNKFNKMLWVKRGARPPAAAHALGSSSSARMSLITPSCLAGSYLIAEVSDVETSAGDKVRGEVVAVVYDAHVRQMRKEGQWCVRPRARSRRRLRTRCHAVCGGRCAAAVGCVPARELLALCHHACAEPCVRLVRGAGRLRSTRLRQTRRRRRRRQRRARQQQQREQQPQNAEQQRVTRTTAAAAAAAAATATTGCRRWRLTQTGGTSGRAPRRTMRTAARMMTHDAAALRLCVTIAVLGSARRGPIRARRAAAADIFSRHFCCPLLP
jgi:hypothetical protein